jgi:hypothetical protein
LSAEHSIDLRVLSLLSGQLGQEFCNHIQNAKIIYSQVELPANAFRPDLIVEPSFWEKLPVDKNDAVLLPLSQDDLTQLQRLYRQRSTGRYVGGFWSHLPAAMVAVLTDDSIADAVTAAQLDFDGIMARPFHQEQCMALLRNAVERGKRRRYLANRFDKLQQLFRQANRNRHHLRNKVDLLCRDLVQSNVDLASTLQTLCKAYDFQSDITGEFDMRFMLHKALRQIKDQLEQSNAAIYLCRSGEFDAHIVGPWYDGPGQTAELETLFADTIVPAALDSRSCITIPDAAEWSDISDSYRQQLAGLSLMALPVTKEQELLAVIVLYRDCISPFTSADKDSVTPLLTPFAQAIESLQRLEHLLTHSDN